MPPTKSAPPIPAPPLIISAPVVVEEVAVALVDTKAPEVFTLVMELLPSCMVLATPVPAPLPSAMELVTLPDTLAP